MKTQGCTNRLKSKGARKIMSSLAGEWDLMVPYSVTMEELT